MKIFEGKVALVTGGGSGIGRAVVETFVKEGAKVGVLERDEKKLEALNQLAGDIVAVQGDATTCLDNKRAVEQTVARFGRLDVLVTCVGVWDFNVTLQDFPEEKIDDAFNEIFNVNVKSFIHSTKAALNELIKNEGSIVYTLSNSAFYPAGGGPLYVSSKFAVRGLVAEMAYELAPKVRVNGVAPGGTLTNLGGLRSLNQDMNLSNIPGIKELMQGGNPLQKVFIPEDHAWTYVYLSAKELSPGVTGVVINSDGGLGTRGIGKVAGLL